MAYDIEAERAKEREIARERGLARMALCEALAEALSDETSETWTRVPWQFERDSGIPEDDPAGFRGAAFQRERDGFTIFIVSDWMNNKPGSMKAKIEWPKNPRDKSVARPMIRDAPGFSYDTPEPGCGFDPKRKPSAIAKHIVRALVTPETEQAFSSLAKYWHKLAESEDKATEWREKVSEAAGIQPRINRSTGATYWPSHSEWCALESSDHYPGGSLKVKLPDDPELAAKLVANLRIVMGESS